MGRGRCPEFAMRRLLVPVLTVLTACGGGEPAKPAAPECALSPSTLAGKAFVMVEATPEGDTLNPRARVRFDKADGGLTAKYTVKSLVNTYDYTCKEGRPGELKCVTEPQFGRICRSLEVVKEGSCSADAIRGLGFEGDAAAIDAAVKEALEEVAKARKDPSFEQYKLMYNNAANTVQGVLYAKVDARKCRLNIDDMSILVFNGQTKEDFNPVGTNPFALTDKEYLFVDCPREAVYADHDAAELPADLSTLQPLQTREVGKDVHYLYVGTEVAKAEEGCTYSADVYANYLSVAKDVPITPGEDGALRWHTTHAWSDKDRTTLAQGKKGGILHAVRKKTCGGETEVIDAVCNYTVF